MTHYAGGDGWLWEHFQQSTSTTDPADGDLLAGELRLNTTTGKIWTSKTDGGTVYCINPDAWVGTSLELLGSVFVAAGTESEAGGLGTGLEAHYLMNDNAADQAVLDNRGNHPGTTAGSTTDMMAVTGKVGGGLSVTPGYIDVGAGIQPTTAFSIAMWIKPNYGSQVCLLYSDWSAGGDQAIHFWINGYVGGVLSLIISDDGYSSYELDGSTPLPTGVWTHIVATFDNGVMNLYVNGVKDATEYASPAASIFAASANKFIGAKNDGGSYPFDGAIDDFRFYYRALTQADIDAILDAALRPVAETLVLTNDVFTFPAGLAAPSVTSPHVAYSPSTPANWAGSPPVTVGEALDRIASVLASYLAAP